MNSIFVDRFGFSRLLKSDNSIIKRLPSMCNLLLATSFVTLLAASSLGATFTVTKTADTNDGVCDADCSLREAIVAANAAATDDTIAFDPAVFGTERTITLNNQNGGGLVIANNSSLTVNGPGRQLLTINGNNNTIVFNIGGGANVSISGVKITGGNPGFLTLGTLTLTDVSITGNGGGIINDVGPLTINNSIISNNTSSLGAGIQNRFSDFSIHPTTVINDSMINNNSSTGSGGGIFNPQTGSLTLNNSVVTGNTAAAGGGIVNSGILNLNNSHVDQNTSTGTASESGGGIQHFFGTLTGTASTINGNVAFAAGGGINDDEGTLNLTNCVISGNTSTNRDGGGIYTSRGTVTLTSVNINNNSACSTCRGGGIANVGFNAILTVTNSSITNNAAASAGGFFHDNSATTTVNNSLIANNTSSGPNGGGGINMGSGTVNLTNTTVCNNTAIGSTSVGGGIVNSTGTVNLTNATIVNNTASASGGGIRNVGGGTVNSRSSIVADNIANDGIGPDIFGTVTSQGYNLIENTSGSTLTGTTLGNILGRNPQLAPLRNNGGTTNTIALQPTSPAIDAGDPNNFPSTDQRGMPRPRDGDLNGTALPDIGAYERTPALFVVSKSGDTNDGNCDWDCSLREAVASANSSSLLDKTIVFDPAIFTNDETVVLSGGELNVTGEVGVFGPVNVRLILSGGNVSRIANVSSGGVLGIRRLTLSHGNGGSQSNGSGGAVNVSTGGTLGLVDSQISGNSVTTTGLGGGGVFVSGRLFAAGTVFSNNSVTLTSDHTLGAGGAILAINGTVELEGSSVTSNSVSTSGSNTILGGGVFNQGGDAHLARCDVDLNTVQAGADSNGGGGGLYNNTGTMTVEMSAIHGNTVIGSGGGINNGVGGKFFLSNSTVSGNSAKGSQGFAGGLVNNGATGSNAATATVYNSTIAYNYGELGQGGTVNLGPDNVVIAKNSIFANNISQSFPDFQGTLTSQGYNLIRNTSGTTIIGTTTGNILGQDPRLDPLLKFNGGPTQTHALRIGSPAIDKGSALVPPLAVDQRGFRRPVDFSSIPNAVGGDGSDIGAFERQQNDVTGTPIFDFDGDGRTDISVFRPSNNTWYLDRSSAGFLGYQFGAAGDIVTPADFTGDGKTDIAVWRPSDGAWYVLKSEDSTFYGTQFGTSGDIPVPADYDGDGKADQAVFRPSNGTWYLQQSTAGFSAVGFGTTGDLPSVGDFDGDGKADIAVYRPSTGYWYRLYSSNGAFFAVQFGASGDKIVPADYTGDGKTDIAVWRPSNGTWYILRSEDLSFYGVAFGTSGDLLAPGDYDGDGKADVGVFRPSEGNWYLLQSTSGFSAQHFGVSEDKPTPNAFVY